MAHSDVISFTVLGANVTIRCAERGTRALLAAHYGQMGKSADRAELSYVVVPYGRSLLLTRDGGKTFRASDQGELLFALDQDLIIQLQKRRRDLYFIHAAALEAAGKVFMLVAASGRGKSTTAWALSHHGIRYLSDELAPVDLAALTVQPYPRALLLKGTPPGCYPLASNTITTSRGLLVATAALSGGICRAPAPLHGIFFLHYSATSAPSARPTSAAEASARLYANVLNALAHPEDGLDAALHIAHRTSCFELSTGDLTNTCAVVKATLDQISPR